ncbi:MAG: NTP transferase domain-containing protein, partial [Rhodomicrobium sp.]|nr:NTP transferase domain-containing protein [Rhodomicrobium sp.]
MGPIYPFILSGGSGTRLWPLSRRAYPKQFLPLTDDSATLFQKTCQRFAAPGFSAPTVLGGHDHRFIIAEQLREIDIAPEAIVLEPIGRNTAPAAAIAALMAERRDENAILLLAPSDHVIADTAAFLNAVCRAAAAASEGALITFGIKPASPHTGYGYIETESGGDALPVRRFVEKPGEADAARYLASGNFFWNAGIFLASASTLIDTFKELAPGILEGCERALATAETDLDFLRLGGGDLRETLTTLFLHYHRPEFTADGVYKGLVSIVRFFDDDDTGDETTGWRLPSGKYDVPLLFQDKEITPDGEMTFDQFATDGF